MPSVRGNEFFDDPEGHAERFVAQLQAEAAVLSVAPPRYEWRGGYWCAVKSNTGWPNQTGWAEHRDRERLFQTRFAELQTEGLSRDEALSQARAYADAEMLAWTTERKEASDRYYAELEADIAREAGGDGAGNESTSSSD
ncbi:hypothetical protein [Rhodococcus sp. ACT016]|uniref:hypothetical protein n=1 Tax=Rhodococcus sp. ACT016 TaxID=3134808 RepID=UPI003D2B2BCE